MACMKDLKIPYEIIVCPFTWVYEIQFRNSVIEIFQSENVKLYNSVHMNISGMSNK